MGRRRNEQLRELSNDERELLEQIARARSEPASHVARYSGPQCQDHGMPNLSSFLGPVSGGLSLARSGDGVKGRPAVWPTCEALDAGEHRAILANC